MNKIETIYSLNKETLIVEETKFDNFRQVFYFITKKEDPVPATLKKLRDYIEYYKKSSIEFEDPIAKMIFEESILKFPSLHVFEDEWETDHEARRSFCTKLRLSKETIHLHDIFALNKFNKDNFKNILNFFNYASSGWSEAVEKAKKEIALFPDVREKYPREVYQKMSFLEKRLIAERFQEFSILIIEDVLEPAHA